MGPDGTTFTVTDYSPSVPVPSGIASSGPQVMQLTVDITAKVIGDIEPTPVADTFRSIVLTNEPTPSETAADVEKHEALATEAQLHEALFGPQPAVHALVAEREPGGEVVGCAIWFLNFSTWLGIHGIYLEDLFVVEHERGTGLGKALLQSLAKIAEHNGLGRVEWSVLKWNTPSIDFYRAIGAVAMDEWDTMRLTGQALADFAAGAHTSRP